MQLTILGCNSATPTSHSHPTSQILQVGGKLFLIDCGEGTQVQLRKYKMRFGSINHIFISHLHGDHCFGLIGLISTLQLLGKTNDLHIYGPEGIKQFIEIQLQLTESFKNYTIIYHELASKTSELIYEDEKLEVYTIPLKHRIYCNGFLFKEKPKERKLRMDLIEKYPEIEVCDYQNIKKGKDFVLNNGIVVPNAKLTTDAPPSHSYAFCSDTMYYEKIIPIIEGVDLLYHEATFLNDKKDLAKKTAHSTAEQAATIAQKAQVKRLVIGHYSNRYLNLEDFKTEAQAIFPETELAEAGKQFVIGN